MNNKTDIIKQFEEAQVSLENFAELMATYYKALVEKGIPEAMAKELTLDYQRIMLGAKRPE